MKKISFIIICSLLFIANLQSSPSIKGDFSLLSNINIDDNFNTNITSSSELNFILNSKSNNIIYTVKDSLIFNDLTNDITNTIEQAYLKFRIPYKENYLIFNFGKTPLDIGGDWIFNSGTPFETIDITTLQEKDNPWIASVKYKLYESENYESLNLELIAKLPVEDTDLKIGGRLSYEINNEYFGTLETSFLTDKTESIISGGYSGTLYFDYGIYGKVDLQDFHDYEASFYLLKLIEDYTLKFEALYDNEILTYILLPTFSYNLDSKSTTSISLNAANINNNWTFMPTVSLNQNIVQGLDFTLNYLYSSTLNHNLSFTVSHKF